MTTRKATAEFSEDQQFRMRHAVEVHGLKLELCPAGCPEEMPRPSCDGCGGAGFVFTFESIKPCGPGCPIGNPQ